MSENIDQQLTTAPRPAKENRTNGMRLKRKRKKKVGDVTKCEEEKRKEEKERREREKRVGVPEVGMHAVKKEKYPILAKYHVDLRNSHPVLRSGQAPFPSCLPTFPSCHFFSFF